MENGMITADQVQEQLTILSFITTITSLVCVENTTNKGGGACYELEAAHENGTKTPHFVNNGRAYKHPKS
jgi:threonine aldolase